MNARLLVALVFGTGVLMLTEAAAQQPQQRRMPAPMAPPPARPLAPATIPHVTAPPRIAAPPYISAPPRVVTPPHISVPSAVARPPHVTAQPHVVTPSPRTPPRIAAPPTTPSVTRRHGPAVFPRAPEVADGPRSPAQPQTTKLNRAQMRELRREESRQVHGLQAEQRQHLRDLRVQGQRHDRDTLRQLRAHNAQQLRDLRTQFRQRRLGLQTPIGAPRPGGKPRITPESARQGRFASRFTHQPRSDRWRTERSDAQTAWRHRHRAAFVAWRGPVFWPYVYTDLFYYPFWPEAYDDAYWAYAYDDFFDSVYWAEEDPYGTYSYGGPTIDSSDVATGRVRTPRDRRSVIDACQSGGGITAWPLERVEHALTLTVQQQTLLSELKAAAAQASNELKSSCPKVAASTPTGRLRAMLDRLQATLAAVHRMRPALTKFYDSLTDEQKARFNALGPNIGEKAQIAATAPEAVNACAGQKSGLTELPIERIEDAVHPTEVQQAALERLGKANDEAVAILQGACPDGIPQTPLGRLDAIEKRLDAMVRAARVIGPALEKFYGSLTDEQKSLFNTLGQ
jgi:hypothetical protein